MNKRFVKCARGAVSLFLVVLLLPFTEIATILISAQRYNSSVAILEEIMDSSLLSTLSNYDSYVRERFGLLSVAQKSEVSDTYNKYFEYNKKGLLNHAFSDNLSIDVSLNPAFTLNDNEILQLQIKEYNKLNAPIKLINDTFDLSELLDKLVKKFNFSNILDLANAGADLCDGALDFGESYEKLKKLSDSITSLKQTYESTYSDFSAAIRDLYNVRDELSKLESSGDTLAEELNDLRKQLDDLKKSLQNETDEARIAGLNNDITEIEKEIKEKEKAVDQNNTDTSNKSAELVQYVNSFAKKRDDFADSHTELISKLGDYQKEMHTALEKINSMISSTGEVITSAGKGLSEGSKLDAKNDNDEIEKKLKEYDSGKEKDSVYYDLLSRQADNNNTIGNYDMTKGIADGLKSSNSEISRLVSEAEDAFDDQAIQSVIDNLTSNKSVVSSLTVNDVKNKQNGEEYYTVINVVLSRDQLDRLYYYFEDLSNDIGLSLSDIWEAIKAFLESVFKIKLVYDPALCSNIDSEYFLSQFGLTIDNPATNPVAALVQAISNVITGIVDFIAGLGSFDFVKAWKGIKNIFTGIVNLLKSVVQVVTQLVSNVGSYISDPSGILLPYYFTQTLPCRTDYKTGKNMTGGKYSKIEYANYGDSGVNGLPLIQDVVSLFNLALGGKEPNDKMFCGAELEYLIAGGANEIANQATVFGMLYVVRLLLDIPGWAQATELQALAAGPHYGIILFLYLALEPFIDCVLLVNGSNVSLWKTTPFLSINGMMKLIPKLVTVMKTDTASSKSAVEKLSKIFNKDSSTAWDDYQTAKSEEKGKSGLQSYGEGLLELSYKEYLMLLMLFWSNHASELSLFKNLIQMETLAYNTANHKGSFDIRKAYTQITCTASGSANPILATSFSDSIFKFSRTQTRGY